MARTHTVKIGTRANSTFLRNQVDPQRLSDSITATLTSGTPSQTALLVVGNTTLSAGDTALRDTLQGMGFTVTVVADSVAEASAPRTVVVVSESCLSTNLGSKYRDLTMPAINFEPFTWDDWDAVAATAQWQGVDMWSYVYSTHPANGGLALDWHQLANGGEQWEVFDAGDAPNGVRTLTGGSAGTYLRGLAFEQGVTMLNGRTAQRRRLFLPWKENFWASGLTTSGSILFQAHVNWAIGGSTSATRPDPPPQVIATAGDASAGVQWSVPYSGGSPITGYRITPYIGTTAQTATFVGTVTSTTVTGLANGTEYTFKVAAINALGTSDDSPSSNAVTPADTPPSQTFSPTIVPLSSDEIINSYRGQNQWITEGDSLKPSWWPWMDSYDRLGWWQIEPSEGNYNFGDIERRLALAASRSPKGRHSIGIMSALSYDYGSYVYSTVNGGNYVPSFNGGVQVPQYIRDSCPGWQRGSAWFPDWNHERYLSRWEALMQALGDAYRDDNRFGYMDIRGYGDFGEWHIFGLEDSVGTLSYNNGFRLVDATINPFRAFPGGPLKKYCVMLTPVDSALRYAVDLDPKVGIRGDCLGGTLPGPFAGYAEPSSHPARQKWRTAPVVAEWCGISDYNRQYQRAYDDVEPYHLTTFSGGNIEADSSQPNYWMYEDAIKRNGYRFELRQVDVGPLTPGGAWAITSTWGNVGVNPAYDPWLIRWELRNNVGTLVASWDSGVSLQSLLPGQITQTDNRTVPTTLATGIYQLSVKVIDPAGYLDPMNMAIQGRQSDGRYILGSVAVG